MAENAKRWRDAGNKTVRPEGYAEQERIRRREAYQNDPAVRERIKAEMKAQRAKRTAEKKQELNQKAREWHKANPGKSAEYNRKVTANLSAEVKQARGKASRTKHRVSRQLRSAIYHTIRYGGEGVISNEHLVGLHKWQDHCCFYCRAPLNGKDTIEHIVPLSRGGTNNPQNVALVCLSCNASKSDRMFCVEWTPWHVLPAPRFHSIEGLRCLKRALAVAGIGAQDHKDHIRVKGRPVFVLSSFWLGWQGSGLVRGLRQAYPTALMLFDKDYVLNSKIAIEAIKTNGMIIRNDFSAPVCAYVTPEIDGFYAEKQLLEARAEYFNPDRTQVDNAKANGLMRVEGLPRLRFTMPA